MKVAIIFAFLLVASFASSFDEVKALVQNDKCAEASLEIVRPQVHEQIQKLKQVIPLFYLRTQTTSPPRLNFWSSSKRLRKSSKNAEFNKRSNQLWVMPLKPPVSDFCSPQTASRMSEWFFWSVIQSLKTQLTLPTTLLSSSSSHFWEDKAMLIANNSSDSSSDLFINLIHFNILFQFCLKTFKNLQKPQQRAE